MFFVVESGLVKFDEVQEAFRCVIDFSFELLVEFVCKKSTLEMYVFAHVAEVLSVGFVWEVEFFEKLGGD